VWPAKANKSAPIGKWCKGDTMKFKQWLDKQRDRQDGIGRLARALADIDTKKYPYSRRRRPDEHRKWASIVTRFTPAHVQSFNKAWREFNQAKAKQQESALN
jgi:hypothetical protein